MMKIIHNGVTRSAPAFIDYEVDFEPVNKSAERNGGGKMMREPLPPKWKLKMAWEFGTPEEYYSWFNFLKGLTMVNFIVEFPAPTGNIERAEFYISPINAKMINFSRGKAGWWKTMKCNFVEV